MSIFNKFICLTHYSNEFKVFIAVDKITRFRKEDYYAILKDNCTRIYLSEGTAERAGSFKSKAVNFEVVKESPEQILELLMRMENFGNDEEN